LSKINKNLQKNAHPVSGCNKTILPNFRPLGRAKIRPILTPPGGFPPAGIMLPQKTAQKGGSLAIEL